MLGGAGILLLSAGVLQPVGAMSSSSAPSARRAVSMVGGVHTTRTVGEAAFNLPGELTDHVLYGLALSRQMGVLRQRLSWELEVLLAGHRDRRDGFRQDYLEIAAVALVRYQVPWRGPLPSSLAAGNGLSYATEEPAVEEELKNGRRRRLLNYLTFELTVDLPGWSGVELLYRLHHRSGVFGLYGGARGASDFYMLGLRKRF